MPSLTLARGGHFRVDTLKRMAVAPVISEVYINRFKDAIERVKKPQATHLLISLAEADLFIEQSITLMKNLIQSQTYTCPHHGALVMKPGNCKSCGQPLTQTWIQERSVLEARVAELEDELERANYTIVELFNGD